MVLKEFRKKLVFYANVLRYKVSNRVLAHGVFRRNFKLDLMLGLSLKQLTGIRACKPSQLYSLSKATRTDSSVLPCKGSLDCGSAMFFYRYLIYFLRQS